MRFTQYFVAPICSLCNFRKMSSRDLTISSEMLKTITQWSKRRLKNHGSQSKRTAAIWSSGRTTSEEFFLGLIDVHFNISEINAHIVMRSSSEAASDLIFLKCSNPFSIWCEKCRGRRIFDPFFGGLKRISSWEESQSPLSSRPSFLFFPPWIQPTENC